jgi:UDP-N-acetylmuramoyl-tripeptide--D-alanyl-D-alanine ligase
MDYFKIFEVFSHIFLTLTLGYYLITNLQWYNYKLERVILKHKKISWHIIYFLLPLFAYYLSGKYFWIYFYFGLIPALFIWKKRLDKPLIFTDRVKRFFAILLFLTILIDVLCLAKFHCQVLSVVIPLALTYIISTFIEKMAFNTYKKEAQEKLKSMDVKIVAITASFGKTSIKNFIYQLISKKFDAYKTPRSVNTLGGLIKDINQDMPKDTKVYIAEAGARERGDIDEIATFLNHHIAVVGSIGEAHIEYFKTLENIRNTKMELLNSNRLEKAFIHKSANVDPKGDKRIEVFGDDTKLISSNLDGITFSCKLNGKEEEFFAPILGSFNTINLTASILVAKELGMSVEEIRKALLNLEQVEHRLQKIEAGGKLIIDDSFNGNLEGMTSSYDLCSMHDGRKVIVTPGIVESTCEANEILAKKIDEIFDIVIITGSLNQKILEDNITRAKKIVLKDKSKLQDILANQTMPGDLIIFSNDAPSFI